MNVVQVVCLVIAAPVAVALFIAINYICYKGLTEGLMSPPRRRVARY